MDKQDAGTGRIWVEGKDLSERVMAGRDFSYGSFIRVCLDGADLSGCSFCNTLFEQCSLRGANLKGTNLCGAMLRGADLTGADIRGANLLSAVLEKAKLDGIIWDEDTRFFQMRCPEKGAFVGYKKCCDDRIVELLIPADAKRSSATNPACRCSKAKVMIIKNFDCSEYYEEAWSLVDENFVYRRGRWVEVPDFDEDRWNDSTRGIHFWMTREEAINY